MIFAAYLLVVLAALSAIASVFGPQDAETSWVMAKCSGVFSAASLAFVLGASMIKHFGL